MSIFSEPTASNGPVRVVQPRVMGVEVDAERGDDSTTLSIIVELKPKPNLRKLVNSEGTDHTIWVGEKGSTGLRFDINRLPALVDGLIEIMEQYPSGGLAAPMAARVDPDDPDSWRVDTLGGGSNGSA